MATDAYRFPTSKLRHVPPEDGKTPLVLVACGSFSPITYLHLRMFTLAFDFVKFNTQFSVVGAYLSPVSDGYRKVGLARAVHRIRMCELATETSKTIMVDPWEALNDTYTPTVKVLEHIEEEVNNAYALGGYTQKVRVALLAGADLIQTMSTPGVWKPEDVDKILGTYGAFVLERAQTDAEAALNALKRWERNIWYIPQPVATEISSTKVRLLRKRGMSIDYLIPHDVVAYIEQHDLYTTDD